MNWWMLVIAGLVITLVVFESVRVEAERKNKFMSWCKLENEDRGYKDIDTYCYYLYHGRIKQ